MTSFKSRLSLCGRNATSTRCIIAKHGCNRDSRARCSQQTVSRALTQEIKRVTGKRQRKAAADSLRSQYSYVQQPAYGRSCTANARKTTTKRGRPTMPQHSAYIELLRRLHSTRRYIDETYWTTDRRSQ